MGLDLRIEQLVDHDISAGPVDFRHERIESQPGRVTVQIFYEGLDTNDVEIKPQQNLDHLNPDTFEDLVDTKGKSVLFKLDKNDKSHVFNIVGWSTDIARIILSSIGSATTGKITKILWFVPQK